MTLLPPNGYMEDPARTKGQQKQAFNDLRDAISEMPGGEPESAPVVISSGSIAPSAACVSVDTEAAAATDDLTNISTTNHTDGRLLLLRPYLTTRIPTVKHLAGGAGQISLGDAKDFALDERTKWLLVKRTGADWEEVARNQPRGHLSRSAVVSSTPYNAALSDRGIALLVNASGAPITVNLPAVAVAREGFIISIKKTDATANAVTIDGSGAETIDGTTTFVLSTQFKSATLACDGSAWQIISEGRVSASGTVEVQDESVVVVASASKLDFQGAGVTVTDGTSGRAVITIPGGGGSLAVAQDGINEVTSVTQLNFTNLPATAVTDDGGGSAGINLDGIWENFGTAILKEIMDAKGDLISASAADTPVRLGVGTNGQVLSANSATATGLEWVAAGAGSGKLLQMVTASTTGTTTLGTTYTDVAGLSASITKVAGSRILILSNFAFDHYTTTPFTNASVLTFFNLVRAASQLQEWSSRNWVDTGVEREISNTMLLMYSDIPAAGTYTYKVQGKNGGGTQTSIANSAVGIGHTAGWIVLMEVDV